MSSVFIPDRHEVYVVDPENIKTNKLAEYQIKARLNRKFNPDLNINDKLLKVNIDLQCELKRIYEQQLGKNLFLADNKALDLRDSVHPSGYYPDSIRYDFDRYLSNAYFSYNYYLKQLEAFAISGAMRYHSSNEAFVNPELLMFDEAAVSLRKEYWI